MSNNLLLKIASDLYTFCHLRNYLGKFLLLGIIRYCTRLPGNCTQKHWHEGMKESAATAQKDTRTLAQGTEPIHGNQCFFLLDIIKNLVQK